MMVRPDTRTRLLIVGLLILGTALVYARVPGFDFVNYDDYDYVKGNPWVSKGLTWEGTKWAFTTNAQANWHPLTYLSLMTDVTLAKGKPWLLHLTNIVLHLCCTVLLFLFLSVTTQRIWPSAFVAAMFGVHPLHVESVAWIAERKDVLSTFCWLLTMLAYAAYVRRRGARAYTLVIVLFALGLMAKPMLVSLPIVLLLMDYWPLGRFGVTGNRATGTDDRLPTPNTQRLTAVVDKLPLFALSALAAGLTLWAQRAGGALCRLEYFPTGIRLANALVSYVGYLGKTIWPTNLAVFYPHPRNTLPEWQVAMSAVLLVSLTALAVGFRKRHPYVYVGWLWYIVTLLPVIGIVQVGEQAMADRYTYVPQIGLFIAIAWLAPEVLTRLLPGRAGPRVLAAAALAATLACTFVAYRQVAYWRNGVTLFRHALSCTSDNPVAHNGLGCALLVDGKRKEAIECFRSALRLAPRFANASVNLGECCVESGDLRQAEALFRNVLRSFPQDDDALYRLGHVLFRRGRTGQAKDLFQRALAINRDNVGALIGLGSISILDRDMELARSLYSKALRIEPDSAEAHFGVAIASDGMGLREQAVPHYRASLKKRYRIFESSNNLAWILATSPDASLRHPAEAIRLAQTALQNTTARKASALDTLAAAYASAGQYSDAVAAARSALSLCHQSGDAAAANRVAERLRLYESGKPYLSK